MYVYVSALKNNTMQIWLNQQTKRYESSNTNTPNSKVHRANMGPIWGRQDPGGPHVGPMNFAIWDRSQTVVN